MKGKLSLGKVLVLSFAGLIFYFGGLYYDKIFLSMGVFILMFASIFFTMVKEEEPIKEELEESEIKGD